MAKREKRYQNFTFLLYPDSAAKDWLDMLKSWHIPMYISLHNHDVILDKATGEIRPDKDHYHVMVMFDSLKSADCLDELIEAVHGVKPPLYEFLVRNKRSYARYLKHMDEDPNEKYPYYLDPDHKVIAIGGAESYEELCKGAAETRQAEINTVKDIQDFCEKREIDNVATFLRHCREVDHDEWIHAIRQNSYFWGMWFNALKNENPKHAKLSNVINKIREEKNNESDN